MPSGVVTLSTLLPFESVPSADDSKIPPVAMPSLSCSGVHAWMRQCGSFWSLISANLFCSLYQMLSRCQRHRPANRTSWPLQRSTVGGGWWLPVAVVVVVVVVVVMARHGYSRQQMNHLVPPPVYHPNQRHRKHPPARSDSLLESRWVLWLRQQRRTHVGPCEQRHLFRRSTFQCSR